MGHFIHKEIELRSGQVWARRDGSTAVIRLRKPPRSMFPFIDQNANTYTKRGWSYNDGFERPLDLVDLIVDAPEPGPVPQPEVTQVPRLFTQVSLVRMSDDEALYCAVADDGTAWWGSDTIDWRQFRPLPPRTITATTEDSDD